MTPVRTVARRFERARALHRAGRLDEAAHGYESVLRLDPGHAPSLHLLGITALAGGDLSQARALVEAAVAIEPKSAAYLQDLAEIHRAAGSKAEAVTLLVQSIELDPEAAGARNNLSMLLLEAGQVAAACALLAAAVASRPDCADFRMNLGCALTAAGRLDDAAAELGEARRLAPDDPAVLLSLGNLAMARERHEEAAAEYRASLAIRPDDPASLVNLGCALKEQGLIGAARAAFATALEIAPELPGARWSAGLAALADGDLAAGWRGWAWRWRAAAVPPHGIDLPEWDGAPLDARRLLVHAEQGLGDTIQFARFLPALAARVGAPVPLLCQPALHRLFTDGGIEIADSPAGYDCRIALMDLPGLLATTIETIPPPATFTVDPAREARWQRRLASLPGRRIGLAWQGARQHANDRNRSLPVELLAPLLELPGMSWCTVQPGVSAPGLVDLGAEIEDFADTAALVKGLDLVISVDTAVAHLAGSLSVPVWLMLPATPDWRWLLRRDDTPWYPSLRLFRQSERGRWDQVITRVAGALAAAPPTVSATSACAA